MTSLINSGSARVPPFANAVYAAATSTGVISYAPSATAGVALDILAESHLPGDLHDAAIADQLRDFHRRDVQRVGERFARGDVTHELCAVVVRGVFLAIELESRRLVIHGGRRCNNGLHIIDGVFKSRCIDERLEDRSWLAMGQGVIQLALPIIPAANHRFDFAGTRVKRD